VVDLLEQRYREGVRFQPTEFIEEGPRVAVRMTVSDPPRQGEAATGVFKVFTFGADEQAVLLQDCTGREDALAHLDAE
jgi:hypothetical protein